MNLVYIEPIKMGCLVFVLNLIEIAKLTKVKLAVMLLGCLLASGCQSPLVSERQMSYEGVIEVNGKEYNFRYPYSCYYENIDWVSIAKEASWHIRQDISQINLIGKLSNGLRYQLFPVVSGRLCADKSLDASQRLFLETPNGNAESYDFPAKSNLNKVNFVESKFVFHGSALAAYKPQAQWGTNAEQQIHRIQKSYYSVLISEFSSENWSGSFEGDKNIKKYLNEGGLLRFESGSVFPINRKLNNDHLFFQEFYRAFRWPKFRIFLAPDSEGKEIWKFNSQNNVGYWVSIPAAANADSYNRWVEYNGSRIEISIRDGSSRLFYDAERDRIIKISTQQVKLW